MFKLTIVTPEKKLVIKQEVDEITVPAFKGELNVLPGHSPLITTLETGVVKWKLSGKEEMNKAAISWGYCQIAPDGVHILADIAELPEEIDYETEMKELALAEAKLANETLSDEEWKNVQREIALSRAGIEALPATKKPLH